MDDLDHESQPRKRRKVSPTSSPTTPLASKALRAVKNVAFGKPLSRTRLSSARQFLKRTHDESDELDEEEDFHKLSNASPAAQRRNLGSDTLPADPTQHATKKASSATRVSSATGKDVTSTNRGDHDLKEVLNGNSVPRIPQNTPQASPYTPRTKLRPETLAKLAQGQKLVRSAERRPLRNAGRTHRGEENGPSNAAFLSGGATSRDGLADGNEGNENPTSQAKTKYSHMQRADLDQTTKLSVSSETSVRCEDDHPGSTKRNDSSYEARMSSKRNFTKTQNDVEGRGGESDGHVIENAKSQSRRGHAPRSGRSQIPKQVKGYVYVTVDDERDEQEADPTEIDIDPDGPTNDAVRRTRSSRKKASIAQSTKAISPQPLEGDVLQDVVNNTERRADGVMEVGSSCRINKRPEPKDLSDGGLCSSRHEEPVHDDLPLHRTTVPNKSTNGTEVNRKGGFDNLRAAINKSSSIHVDRLKSSIISVLTGRTRLTPIGLSNQLHKVSSLLRQTILAGEGNSMLVVGPRGSGKTTLVEHAISEIANEVQGAFHVVRLSGFICTDDKIALREIWRQLGQESEDLVPDDSEGPRGINYADALTRLLALLNHPAHPGGASKESEDKTARSSTKAVVFVLDEFHLFASHSRQTLLYNLFDCAQSSSAPIAVLGLSTKLDVAEMLEKRVKSRFSQRQVLITPPKTLTAFKEICVATLTPQSFIDSKSTSFFAKLAKAQHVNNGEKAYKNLCSVWTSYVSTYLFDARSDPDFAIYLTQLFARPSAASLFQASALLPISCMSANRIPTGQLFLSQDAPVMTYVNAQRMPGMSTSPTDSKLPLLSCLSTLEMSLLICAARMEIVLNDSTAITSSSSLACTFEAVYAEYLDLATRAKVITSTSPFTSSTATATSSRVFSKRTAKGAWENLCCIGLLTMAGSVGRIGSVLPAGSGNVWRCEVALEEIACLIGTGAGLGGAGTVLARWCRDL